MFQCRADGSYRSQPNLWRWVWVSVPRWKTPSPFASRKIRWIASRSSAGSPLPLQSCDLALG
jgi:hypothetical protein